MANAHETAWQQLQGFDEEEPRGGKMLCDRVGVQFPIGKQMRMVFPDLFRA
jgi:hypothetical protein